MLRISAAFGLLEVAAAVASHYCAITQDIFKGDYFWSTIVNGSGTISESLPLPDLFATGSLEPGISCGAANGKFYVMSGNSSFEHALYVIDPSKQQHGFLPVLLPGWEAYAIGNLNVDAGSNTPIALIVGEASQGVRGAVIAQIDNTSGNVSRILADISSTYRSWTQLVGGISAWDGLQGMYYTIVQTQGGGGAWQLVGFNTSIPAGRPGAGVPALTVSLPNDASWLMSLGISPVLAQAYPGTLGLVALVIDEDGDGSALWMLGKVNVSSPATEVPHKHEGAPTPPAPWVSLHQFDTGFFALPNPGNYMLSINPAGDTAYVLLYQLFANQTGTQVTLTMDISVDGSVRQLGPVTRVQVNGQNGVVDVTALAACPQ